MIEEPIYNRFSRHLLQTAYSNHYENYAVCPVGVLFVLTTLLGSNGIRQNTARQVKYALKIQRNENSSARQRAKNLYLFLKKSLSAEKTVIQQNEVNVVSAETGVFLKQKYPFDKRFKRLVKNEFMCEVKNVDFEDQTASVSMINNWVKKKSGGLIDQYFKTQHELPSDIIMAVINVVTFKDVWKKKFDGAYVFTDDFWVNNLTVVKTDYMRITETVGYAAFWKFGFRMISKDFKNSRFKFVIALPIKKFNLNRALNLLKGIRRLPYFVRGLQQKTVYIQMPKFKISNTLDLIQTMKKMGVSDMFVGWKANLSGIANVKNLKVDYLRQSTVLKVDEKGVEATAATSLYSLGRSFYIKPANITFTVDQPFVCFIYDNKLRMPLFAALVKKPGVEE